MSKSLEELLAKIEAHILEHEGMSEQVGWNMAKDAASWLVLELSEDLVTRKLAPSEFYAEFRRRFPTRFVYLQKQGEQP